MNRLTTQLALASGGLLVAFACGGTTRTGEQAADTSTTTTTTTTPDSTVEFVTSGLNLNAASAEEIATIPGVGDRMVREFLEYRPYVSIEEFRLEIGKYVDSATVAAYEEYVYVPINPDSSDQATLQQLPSVGEVEAAALITGRPYADTEASLAALSELVGAEAAAEASSYLEES